MIEPLFGEFIRIIATEGAGGTLRKAHLLTRKFRYYTLAYVELDTRTWADYRLHLIFVKPCGAKNKSVWVGVNNVGLNCMVHTGDLFVGDREVSSLVWLVDHTQTMIDRVKKIYPALFSLQYESESGIYSLTSPTVTRIG